MEEIWKKSDFGMGNYFFSNLGRVYNTLRKDYVKGVANSRGYLRICNTATKTRVFIHKEVAKLFLGECPEGFVVNHKDGNPLNNRVDNLEYISQSDNIKHSILKLNKTKTTSIEKSREIIEDYKSGLHIFELAKKYNLHRDTIYRILIRFGIKTKQNQENQQSSSVYNYEL